MPLCIENLLIQKALTKCIHKKKPVIKLTGFCVVVAPHTGDFD
jgi:hypothetical protein